MNFRYLKLNNEEYCVMYLYPVCFLQIFLRRWNPTLNNATKVGYRIIKRAKRSVWSEWCTINNPAIVNCRSCILPVAMKPAGLEQWPFQKCSRKHPGCYWLPENNFSEHAAKLFLSDWNRGDNCQCYIFLQKINRAHDPDALTQNIRAKSLTSQFFKHWWKITGSAIYQFPPASFS